MKAFLATTCIVTGALLAGGCATKKYVQNTAAPIQAKVDQVGEQTSHNGQQIEDTRNQVKQVDEKAQTGISAAQERAAAADQHAATADQHAGEAMARADKANKLGEKNTQDLSSLRTRGSVANIDDYKLQTSVAVPFSFNKYALNDDAKADLDKLAKEVKSGKRFFIAVEGYTDSTGSKDYNEVLEPPSRGQRGGVSGGEARYSHLPHPHDRFGPGEARGRRPNPRSARQEPPRGSEGLQRRSGHRHSTGRSDCGPVRQQPGSQVAATASITIPSGTRSSHADDAWLLFYFGESLARVTAS